MIISLICNWKFMNKICIHKYPEPSERDIVQCSEDYIMFRVRCIHCEQEGFAGGFIDWKLTYWPEDNHGVQPHNPL